MMFYRTLRPVSNSRLAPTKKLDPAHAERIRSTRNPERSQIIPELRESSEDSKTRTSTRISFNSIRFSTFCCSSESFSADCCLVSDSPTALSFRDLVYSTEVTPRRESINTRNPSIRHECYSEALKDWYRIVS